MENAHQERRRFSRCSCSLRVQLRPTGQPYPTNCETADISLCGCYVKLMLPLPVGTLLDVRIWTGDTPVQVKAVVKTSHPGVGNGIDFIEMSSPDRFQLERYLETLPEPQASEFIP